MVDARNRELEDRRKRYLNLTMFNLLEPNEENSAANKQADEQAFKIICRRLGLEEVNVMSSFRLGRKSENKIRPIKLTLSDKSHRKCIIEKCTFQGRYQHCGSESLLPKNSHYYKEKRKRKG